MESTASTNPIPIGTHPPANRSVSLILLAELPPLAANPSSQLSLTLAAEETKPNSTDHQIWHITRMLESDRRETQVLLVDPHATLVSHPINSLASNYETSYRPEVEVVQDLGCAISAAKHATILMVDPSQLIDRSQWNLIADRLNQPGDQQVSTLAESTTLQSPIHCVFNKPNINTGLKRALLAFYLCLVRFLQKTNKTEFESGFVVASRDQCKLLNEKLCRQSNDNNSTNLTELLAIARLNHVPVVETETRHLGYVPNANPIRYKQILQSVSRTIRFWWNKIEFPLPVHDDPSRQHEPAPKYKWAAWAILLIGVSAVLLNNLNYALFEPDEARNAQLAMNIIDSGDWLSLTLADQPYWDKPPLQIWAIATSYKMFGVSPIATRIPGALATAFSILLTFFLGKRLVGFRPAFLGALGLLLSTGFVLIGRYVTMDASLTCCLVLMTLSLMLAGHERDVRRPQSIWLLLAGIAAGLGLLIKGPVILVLGLPPVLVAYWLAGQTGLLKHKRMLFFVAPMLLIAVPWYLATAIVHPDFLVYFFWKHHIVRFSDAFNHREPFYYYLPAIFLMMFPVSYLLPSLVKFLTTRKPTVRTVRTSAHGFLCLTAMWIIGFFSISESKLPTYILPALPSVCLLCGVLLDKKIFAAVNSSTVATSLEASRQSASSLSRLTFLQRLPQRSVIGLVGLCAAIIVVMKLVVDDATLPAVGLLVTGSIALVVAAWIPFYKPGRPQFAWAGLAVAAFGFVLVSVTWLTPEIAQIRSTHSAAMKIKSQPGMNETPILFFGREDYGAEMIMPVADMHRFDDDEQDEVCQFLKQHPESIIVSSDGHMKSLRKALKRSIRIDTSELARHLYVTQLDLNSPDQPHTAQQRSDENDDITKF